MVGIVDTAAAADGIPNATLDAQAWRLPVDASRTLWADDAGGSPGFSTRLGLGYMKDPFVWKWADTGETVPIVGDVLGVDAIAAYRIWRIRAGIDLPLYPLASGANASGGGLGDLALDLKGVVLDPAKAPVGLALTGRFAFPTATTAVPLGGDGVGWETALVADKTVGPVLLAANIGVRGLPGADLGNVTTTNQFSYRLGAGIAASDAAGVSLDLAGAVSLDDPGNAAGSPLEAMVGGWYHLSPPLTLRAGLGRGLTQGIGAPAFRGVLALGWEPGAGSKTPKPTPTAKVTTKADSPPPPRGMIIIDGTTKDPPGTVRIDVRDENGAPIDATVTFDQHPPAPIGGGRANARVATGTWTVVFQAAGHIPQAKTVLVESGKSVDVKVTLKVARVTITADRLQLAGKIAFEGSKIRTESIGLMDEVLATLQAHPEITGVRIESHTDSRASVEYALTLSGARAAAVQAYLVQRGLSPDKFVAAGYGGSRPLVKADNDAAWEKNDRIEFVITERSGTGG